jgi:O-6-methylguanine DNA methyltransferase
MIQYRLLETGWGMVSYLARDDKLIKLILPPALPGSPSPRPINEESFHREQCERYCRTKNATFAEDKSLLPILANDLCDYFSGKVVHFNCPCDLGNLTDFSKQVLEATSFVTYGHTSSYGDIARIIHKPKSFRAVARALGANPIPIIIPCHRIINSNGQIGGYSGSCGVTFKSKLLEMEKSHSPNDSSIKM